MICFWICIFEISNTPSLLNIKIFPCCDLLLNLYLWNIKYTRCESFAVPASLWFAFEFVSLKYQIHLPIWRNSLKNVVICFWICIFEISNTPWKNSGLPAYRLWFAFEFVSLKYQIHHYRQRRLCVICCDLLLNLYLWNIKYTRQNRY